jgi:2,3-dimethylmalate lyase
MKNSTALRQMIMERRAVVVPGCYDVHSALIIEACGFEAVQVSGFGLAGSYLGLPDVGLMQLADILEITRNIVDRVKIPVMADIDTGGGNAINAREVTRQVIQMGCAGLNIEDQEFPKRCGHMDGKRVISIDEMCGKIRSVVDIRNLLDPDFIINARTDAFGIEGLEAAIIRCQQYLLAGADLVFIDGIKSTRDITTAIHRLDGPLSVNLMDGVTGVKTKLIPISELAQMGVGRVSIPVASIMVAHKALMAFFTALKASPTGLLEGQTDLVSTFTEYTDFVGLPQYRELERRFLV